VALPKSYEKIFYKVGGEPVSQTVSPASQPTDVSERQRHSTSGARSAFLDLPTNPTNNQRNIDAGDRLLSPD
jgi:hypothetical protein